MKHFSIKLYPALRTRDQFTESCQSRQCSASFMPTVSVALAARRKTLVCKHTRNNTEKKTPHQREKWTWQVCLWVRSPVQVRDNRQKSRPYRLFWFPANHRPVCCPMTSGCRHSVVFCLPFHLQPFQASPANSSRRLCRQTMTHAASQPCRLSSFQQMWTLVRPMVLQPAGCCWPLLA